jgi:tetratricopeptide (TPR) repeat protein
MPSSRVASYLLVSRPSVGGEPEGDPGADGREEREGVAHPVPRDRELGALVDHVAQQDDGLAHQAVLVRTGRLEAAESAYVKLVQADPRDAEAQAALMALRGGRVDPQAAESRLKTMLAADPKAHALNFALGNQFAQQGRWAEAQQEYFKAFAAEPDNADFAYNLAVSLEHVRQPKLALEYYRRALALAKTRGASFDPGAAEARVAQLGR